MSAEASLPKVFPVTIFEGTEQERVVEVRKLALGKSAQLALAFRGLPKRIQELSQNPEIKEVFSKSDETPLEEIALQLIQFLPEILEVAADGIMEVLSVGTGISLEEIQEVGLDEASELFLAIVTVNNLRRISENVKNALGRLGIDLKGMMMNQTPEIQTSGSKT